jgi:hypothetical protein
MNLWSEQITNQYLMLTNFKTIKAASLVTTLGLMLAIGVTSCGQKEAEAPKDAPKADAPSSIVDKAASTATGAVDKAASTATGAVDKAVSAVAGKLSAADKTAITPAKAALVMASSAVKSGDMTKAKAQFEKFSGVWKTVEPIVKAKAGDKYPLIEGGIKMVTDNFAAPTPDKAKVGEGLTKAVDALNALLK